MGIWNGWKSHPGYVTLSYITDMFHKYRSRSFKMFCKNGVLESFSKFTRKYLCRSLLLKKWQATGWLKRDSDTGAFLRIVQSLGSYFEELPHVNNDSKLYNNNLLRENEAPTPTGIRKDNSWSIWQLSCCCLYQQPRPQSNLKKNSPGTAWFRGKSLLDLIRQLQNNRN